MGSNSVATWLTLAMLSSGTSVFAQVSEESPISATDSYFGSPVRETVPTRFVESFEEPTSFRENTPSPDAAKESEEELKLKRAIKKYMEE